MNQKNKIDVSILGRGDEQVSVENISTISELRTLLSLDKDVIASDENGNELQDNINLSQIKQINFAPNVVGG